MYGTGDLYPANLDIMGFVKFDVLALPLQCFWKKCSTLYAETEESGICSRHKYGSIFKWNTLFSQTDLIQAPLMNPTTFEGNNKVKEISFLTDIIYGLITKTRCVPKIKRIQCRVEIEDRDQILQNWHRLGVTDTRKDLLYGCWLVNRLS